MSKKEKRVEISQLLIAMGVCFVLAGFFLGASIFYPVIFQEIRYTLSPGSNNINVLSRKDKTAPISASIEHNIIRPLDEEFGIVIPKIGANAKVIANVSPFNEKEYQVQLTKGVAHARDTTLPGEYGNMFIFAHSAANWYQANRYNAVFYLLTKLKKDDDVYLFYEGEKFKYKVTDQKLVSPDRLQYLAQDKSKKTLTLMTCWPPGTTLERLIIQAKISP